MAAIGVLVEELKLPTSKPLKVQLGLLLPWNEYSDRHRFIGRLKQLVSSFEFRRLPIKVNLERLICRPEGGGLAAIRIKYKGIDWLRKCKIGVLMFGHRNTTFLVLINRFHPSVFSWDYTGGNTWGGFFSSQ